MRGVTLSSENAQVFDLARHIVGDLKLNAARTLALVDTPAERIRIVIATASEVGAWACGTVHGLTKTTDPMPTGPELFRWLADQMERANASR